MSSDLAAGTTLGRYRIEAVAGRGGMAVVYRAVDTALGRPVALKVLPPEVAADESFVKRFTSESCLAASIDHPNVVPIYEADESDGHVFIAMRFVEGEDLEEIVRRDGALPPERVAHIVRQVAAALDAAHRIGLVHRDVKPGNVLLDDKGHAYLTDFGLAKSELSSAALTRAGMVLGTADYLAPEQVRGAAAGPAADIYALGCMTFELLSGRSPFAGRTEAAMLMAHVKEDPPVLSSVTSGLPAQLDGVLATALAKEPKDRPTSAGEVARGIEAAIAGTRTLGRGRWARRPRRRPSPREHEQPPQPSRSGGAAMGGAGPARRGRRWRLALGIGYPAVLAIGLVVAALAATGVLDAGDRGRAGRDDARGATRLEGAAAAPRAIDSIDVGGAPAEIAFDGSHVWVTDRERNRVVALEPGGVVVEEVDLGGPPASIAAADGVVWAGVRGDDAVERIDVRRAEPVAVETIPVGRAPEAISLGRGLVWVANRDDGSVHRIDRATSRLVPGAIRVGSQPFGVHAGPRSVWVANGRDGTVTRIDASTAKIAGAPIRVARDARDVLEAAGAVWVLSRSENAVYRLDPDSGRRVAGPIAVGRGPTKLAAGLGAIWVTNRGDGTVSRIDPATNRVVGSPIRTGSMPGGIAVGGAAVWVAHGADGTVARIAPSR